jgi:hypothetical protein
VALLRANTQGGHLNASYGRDDDQCDYRQPRHPSAGRREILSERGISRVPVVDAGSRLVGIVSEGDLLHRVSAGRIAGPGAGALGGSPRLD